MAGYHWYAKGDGLVLSTLSFKEGINEDEVDDLVMIRLMNNRWNSFSFGYFF